MSAARKTLRIARLVILLGVVALAASSCTGYMSVSVPGPIYGSSMSIGVPLGHP